MTKSDYARSLNVEVELEKVKKQRDALLSSLKELMRLDHKDTPVYSKWKKDWHVAIDKANQVVKFVESTKGG